MTLSSTVNRVSYAGNASTTAFAFSYLTLADDDLKVILVVDSTGVETTQTITTHYTVAGSGSASVTVNMVTAPATGETLVIIRQEQLTQGLDLVENDPFPSALVEQQFDSTTMMVQQLNDEIQRSVHLSDGDTTGVDPTLPTPVALKTFRWNAGLTALEEANDPGAAETAAAASAAAALVSENNASTSASNASTSETNAAADLVLTNADVVLTGADVTSTNADVLLTAADVVSTNADVLLTAADVVSTAADLVATNQDTLDTAADLVATNQDTIDTAADAVATAADAVATAADLVLTNADVLLTNADVVSTNADVVTTNANVALIPLSKYDATVAPTANEDSGDGYGVGSHWVDVTADKTYVLVDATVASAVWNQVDSTFDAASPGAIGGTTPGSFNGTTGTFSGVLSVDGTTDSTSGTTGSIHTDGGLGVAKDIYTAANITTEGVIKVTQGSVGAPTIADRSDTDTGWNLASLEQEWVIAGVERMRLNGAPNLYINDTGDNSNMDGGITVNQGSSDSEILSLKSSDVAHGFTSITETDTYYRVSKLSGTAGGTLVYSMSENQISGFKQIAVTAGSSATKSTSADGTNHFIAGLTDGANGWGSLTANANVFAIGSTTSGGSHQTQWICDAEGDTHYNGADNAGAWDIYQDVSLLDSFRYEMTQRADRGLAKRTFSNWTKANAQVLHDTGVITMNDDGNHFVSTKGLNALIIDTIRQEAAKSREALKVLDEMVPGFGMKLANALKANNLPALT